MTAPMPSNAPDLQRNQAELQDLRWVAQRMIVSHDRSAARLAAISQTPTVLPSICLCSLCRHARPWVTEEPRYCAGLDEREVVS